MNDEFETMFTVDLKGGGNTRFSFPLPPELQIFGVSKDFQEYSIEYYLLARYAYIHNMSISFIINSFWTVEYLLLSLLIFKYKDLSKLKSAIKLHDISAYWKEVKKIIGKEQADKMSHFDPYIANVKGYYSKRYPELNDMTEILTTAKKSAVRMELNGKAMKFNKSYKLEIDKLDHFVSFMLYDICKFGGGNGNLYPVLTKQNNIDLYLLDNKYSIIPPKKYKGV